MTHSPAVTINVMPHDARHVVARATDADRRGLGRLVLPDAGAATRDPWTVLGAAAVGTTAIRLGMITNPLTRRPEVTAGALGTLDELSGGRGFAVLSVGGAFQLAGLGVPHPARIADLTTALRTVRDRHRSAELWVATKGPATLRAVAGLADTVLLSGVPFPLLPDLARRVRSTTGARVALTLHHWFDPESRLHSGERLVYEITNMRPEYADAGGVHDSLRTDVLSALARSGPVEAGRLIPDTVLRRFYLDAPATGITDSAVTLATGLGVDEIVLPEYTFYPNG
ncbi:LLM class flavin-dependent oxidoreductase [Nocardia sp. alder85J]|uniref:LLM class flavin-dependent oxidoreductase n=1 Tax=Nocardia sp. alder85J TaxID=2862949 RepID=UPI001CD53DE3|nr:LLM class flavin-dependent oxidoreductase [Nocardia sp. alder85J]MCX4092864.1 LLM class flavin-dependent oxidoreductase [Nocardia sp. alder85J]